MDVLAAFKMAFRDLVDYCFQYTNNIIIADLYWRSPVKEQAMLSVAREYELPYVPLFWIYANYYEEVQPHVGDSVYDRHGNPFLVPTEFICTHLNDEGMKMIVEAIWRKVDMK